ncbi:glycosyltransferase [Palleronia abyssalis]|uniref:Rhamnosyltransferase n=1 Tax=Palleronia abyssalis TaxID=1501240 RepID=A0A2R8BY02_9RHOB|nr:glycosyltransferase [Palleronia abyssalis]SPJ25030.1 hypothetical protein PAA8504_02873 [Palleronia abyssalis]
MSHRVQVVGLVRFSFATIGNFYPGFDGIDAMEAFLFDPERLQRRFRLFETFCLPSLKGQTDQDFTCILLVGSNLPAPWKSRLSDLIADTPSIRVIEAKPQHHYSGIKAAFQAVSPDDCTHRITFRFDDDDALDNDFVARLKRTAPGLLDISGGDLPVALAHNLGFFLEERANNVAVYPVCERTPLSVGAALIAPREYVDNIYKTDHRQLPQFFDCWLDTKVHSYVRTVHRDNKANPHVTGRKIEMPNSEIDAILKKNFGRKLGEMRHYARGSGINASP